MYPDSTYSSQTVIRVPNATNTGHTARHGRKALSALGVLMLFALVLAACGSSGGNGTTSTSGPKTGGTLNVGLDSDVVTLDPLKSSALVDRQVMLNIYDTLVASNAKNEIVPDLATSWTSPSPTQVVFTLRTGVNFTDGTPFNADAVVFNINRILTTPSSPRHSELVTVSSVQAIDPTHIQFNLKAPFAPLLATLSDRAGMMLSPAVVQAQSTQLGNNPTNAGTGPFMFSSWVKGSQLTIARNPHYWAKDSNGTQLPYLDKVIYHPITNESVRYTNLETGTINAAEVLGSTDVVSAKSNAGLVYKQISGLSFFGFMLNTKVAPLNNVHVRRAVAYAVNRDEILSKVLDNVGVIAQGPIPPGSWAYNSSFTGYSNDINSAKNELSQAGMSSVTFTLSITSGSPQTAQLAQYIAAELAQAGITVNIKQETFAALLSDTSAPAFNYQAGLIGWSGRVDPDGNMYAWFHTGGGFNGMQYSNPQVDSLLEQARASSDQATRATDYQQAEQLIVQDASYIFLYHGVSIQATTKNVQNFALIPTGIMIFTQTYLS